MKAILLKDFGGIDQMYFGEAPMPQLSSGEVLVEVKSAALNRADILQRKGLYPPPRGASEILGLEIAGRVVDTSPEAQEWEGAEVMALLTGGGYAEYVSVHKNLLVSIPSSLNFDQAAGIMEAFLTGWQALIWLGSLKQAQHVLIHAGASGVGSACIQLAKILGATVSITASAPKHALCRELGADQCINYTIEAFDEVLLEKYPLGADLIIDFIGNPYLNQNLRALTRDGKMVMLGLMGGTNPVSLNLAPVIFKRLKITGSTLRSRSLRYRGKLVKDFWTSCCHHFVNGTLKPVIDRVIPWQDVKEAHQLMEENKNQGKIILSLQ